MAQIMSGAIINWNKLTAEDYANIHKATDRALDFSGTPGDQRGMACLSIEMTLGAAHTVCPIDWERLLAADDGNFMHDVCGICNNFSQKTGRIENGFVPRFARGEVAP